MRNSVALIARYLAIVMSASLIGCGLVKDKADETKDWSAQRLYSEAKSELDSGNYEKAVKLFETLESRYPFGRFAQQAQLDMAYAYYKDDEPLQAVAGAERFIKMHPNHPNVDYAYYLKGLANFQDDLGLFGALGSGDLSDRDPKAARDSFDAFKDLATRFPSSKYTPDAIQRMKYLVNALASHEVHVARYYYKRGAYLAAANRAQHALANYPQAPALEEGLYLMMKSYEAMGIEDLRKDAERVFAQNFPNSKYLTGAADRKAWWKLW